jgi:hypothetical protein
MVDSAGRFTGKLRLQFIKRTAKAVVKFRAIDGGARCSRAADFSAAIGHRDALSGCRDPSHRCRAGMSDRNPEVTES